MRILRLLGRLIGYAFAALLLTALGMVVFFWARYQPRATLPGSVEVLSLSPDGGRLLGRARGGYFCPMHPAVMHNAPDQKCPICFMPLSKLKSARNEQYNAGDLQVWDTRNGTLLRTFPASKVPTLRYSKVPLSFLQDWNPVLTLDNDQSLCLADWTNDRDGKIEFRKAREVAVVTWSPQGRWLIADTKEGRTLLDTTGQREPAPLAGTFDKFSPDDRLQFFREPESLTVRDIDTGNAQTIRIAPHDRFMIAPNSGWMALSRDSKRPAADPPGGFGFMVHWFMGTWTHRLEFRTLPEGDVQGQLELPDFGLWMLAFAPDSRRAAVWRIDPGGDVNLVLVDTPSGRAIAQVVMPPLQFATFSPDSKLVHCQTQPEDRHFMLDAATGKRLWEKKTVGWLNNYGQGSDLVFQEDHDKRYQLLDGPTGAVRLTLPLDFPTQNHLPSFTPDGRRLVIRGWRQLQREPHFWETWLAKWRPAIFGDELEGVIVVDTSTGQELLRLVNRAQVGDGRYLCDDGEILVTIDGDENDPDGAVISVWEVSPRRAWTWALGVVAAACVLACMVRVSWKKWRRGPTIASATPSPPSLPTSN